MALEKRRFTEKVEFLTSIGFGDGSADYREKAGVTGSRAFLLPAHMSTQI